MRTRMKTTLFGLLASGMCFAAHAEEEGWLDSFTIDDRAMVSKGRNTYWPLTPGRFSSYSGNCGRTEANSF